MYYSQFDSKDILLFSIVSIIIVFGIISIYGVK
jgi:hypothetical protein